MDVEIIKLNKMKKKIIIISVVCVLLLSAALVWFFWPQKEKKLQIPKSELNEAKRNFKLQILRYDQDLMKINQNQLEEGIRQLADKYPSYLIDKNAYQNPQLVEGLRKYLNDPILQDLFKQSQKQFSSFEIYENEIIEGFAHYLVYFPNQKVPQIITMIPGLDLEMPSIYIFEDIVYINLDLYLGNNYAMYNKMGIPKYISERMDSKYITVDLFKKAMVYKHLPNQVPLTLLEAMIIEGKKLYFTEMMLPDKPLQDIIGYSEEKYSWAEKFYPNVWGYLIENNLLYSKEDDAFRKYVEEAPFSKPFGNVSPGRIGQFLGWKIVKAYMENNPKITLSELMQTTDLQMILNKSAFKPIIKK
mgnify:CR=1 FL=1